MKQREVEMTKPRTINVHDSWDVECTPEYDGTFTLTFKSDKYNIVFRLRRRWCNYIVWQLWKVVKQERIVARELEEAMKEPLKEAE